MSFAKIIQLTGFVLVSTCLGSGLTGQDRERASNPNEKQGSPQAKVQPQNVQQQNAQDPSVSERLSQLESRLDKLDQRLARIENVLFATIKFSEADARKQLDEARAALAQSERLHAQGLMSAVQLQLDRMSLNRAETLLRMCIRHEDHRKIGATLDLLDAKREYEHKLLTLQQTEFMFRKGLMAKEQISIDKANVLLAGQKLKLAETKLKKVKEMIAEQKSDTQTPKESEDPDPKPRKNSKFPVP